ncbi:MAG: DMT family transporter [Rubrobacter sp.]|nr:EamA family transporter [Actinomycetota bacterium]MDQ3436501.1 EamA family transporter [Actinomycetota bacterium]
MRPRDFAGLVLLGALWGGSFLFIRVAVPALGPFLLAELRVALAAVALFLFALAAGRVPEIRHRWRSFLVLGFLNAAVPFSLISAAEIHLTASLAAILNSTTVMFSAIVAAVWIGDVLTARKAIGIVLGIIGVSVLVGWDPLPLSGGVLLAVAAMLVASLSYALGATYAKRSFSGIPPVGMAIGQLGGAIALLLPLAVVSLPEEAPSLVVALSMLGLALLSTSVAYLIYFRLIENVGPTSTVTVTLLVPVFGLLFGVLLLDEPFGPGTLAGLAIILTSVVLITGISPRKNKPESN